MRFIFLTKICVVLSGEEEREPSQGWELVSWRRCQGELSVRNRENRRENITTQFRKVKTYKHFIQAVKV